VALTLLAEAAWLTLLGTLAGWLVAFEAGLVPFSGAAILLLGGWVFGKTAPTFAYRDGERLGGRWAAAQSGTAAALVYVVVALGPTHSAPPSFGWPAAVAGGTLPSAALIGIGVSTALALWGWRRAVVWGLEDISRERLIGTLRLGISIVLLGALAETGCECGVLSVELSVVFFVAVLAALALAQIGRSGTSGRTWSRVVVTTLSLTLGVSAAAAALGDAYGRTAARWLGQAWRATVSAFVEVLAFLLAPVLDVLFALVAWLKRELGGELVSISSPSLGRLGNLDRDDLAMLGDWSRGVVHVLFLGVAAFLLYKALTLGHRSRFRSYLGATPVARETIDEQVDEPDSIWSLLKELLPAWAARGHGRPTWPHPTGSPEVVAAVRLYFTMLDLALDRGWTYVASATPAERCDTLHRYLPGATVEGITTCFNRACYGGIGAGSEELSRLATTLRAPRPTPDAGSSWGRRE